MTLSLAAFQNVDIVLSDDSLTLPLMIEWGIPVNHYFHTGPYFYSGDDLLVERRDMSDQMSENKMDGFWWDSQRSWHLGAGQQRFDAATSSPYAFFSSKGIDITTRGQATLLPATSKVLSLTNVAAPPHMIATDTAVWVADTQPNLKRFGALDASDVTAVSTGTETSQNVQGLATDGSIIYAGLGPDGIHKTGSPTFTQVEAFDATTGWAGTGTFAIDTANKKEGAASLHLSGDASVDISKTLGASFAASAADGFSFWFYWSGTASLEDFRIRLKDGSGNYFERQMSGLGIAAGSWYQDVSYKSEWTQVGTVGTITTIELLRVTTKHALILDDVTFGTMDTATNVLTPVIADVWVDDLERFTIGNLAHWSDHDARVVAWVKDTLYAAGLKNGSTTQYEFYEAASGAGSTVALPLPDGFVVSAICELGPYIYFSAYRAGRGVVYCYDGTNAPFIAGVLPVGDQARSLTPFLGAGMLVGARRINAGSGAQGILYRAFPSSDGHLTLERVATIGTAGDGNDYGVRCGTQYGDNVYFGWSYADASSSGLGIYLPDSGGYSRHLDAATSGIVRAVVVFDGRRIFSIDGAGAYVEQTTLVSSGDIVGSVMDWNIDPDKMLVFAEAGYLTLPSGAAVKLDYSLDEGTTWTTLGSSDPESKTIRQAINTLTPSAQYRVWLYPGGNVSPILKKAGLAATYGKKPEKTHNIFIRAYARQEKKNLVEYMPWPVSELSTKMVNQLITWYNTQTVLNLQSVDWDITQSLIPVRISSIDVGYIYEAESGRRDTIHLQLTEVPQV